MPFRGITKVTMLDSRFMYSILFAILPKFLETAQVSSQQTFFHLKYIHFYKKHAIKNYVTVKLTIFDTRHFITETTITLLF